MKIKLFNSEISITDEQVMLAAAAAIVLCGYFAYKTVYAPLFKELSAVKARYNEAMSDITRSEKIVQLAREHKSDKRLIKEDEISVAIDEITKLGKDKGLNFVSIKPGDMRDEGAKPYRIQPIDLELTAPPHKMAQFLGSLDELKSGIVRVESLDLKSKENDAGIVGSATLEIYVLKDKDAPVFIPESAPPKRKARLSSFKAWKRNPMAPKGASETPVLNLSGILGSKGNYKAMIGDAIVKKGDKVAGYTVEEVLQDSVILKNGSEKIELKLQ